MAEKAEEASNSADKLTDSGEETRKGSEPGGGEGAIIVATDSYEDLSYESFESEGLQRHPSGTISQIAKETSIDESLESAHIQEPPAKVEQANANKNNEEEKSEDTISQSSENTSTQDNVNEDRSGRSSVSEALEDEEHDESGENVHSEEWRQKDMHIFILSEAGKPIYSRYGKEDKLVTIMGVMQALVSFIQDSKDNMRAIVSGDHQFVFLVREHIILVCVSKTTESVPQLILRLTYVYNQIISVLTYKQLSKIFETRRNYDLRRLLSGTEKFIDNLLNLMDHDPSFLLGAVRCLPLPNSIRETIAQTVTMHAKVKDLVFAILIANNQLVTLVRMKKYFLHPLDLHLIINLVSASESFKAAESWTPICLPKFDTSGYLHGHVSYLDEECNSCLLLLTVDRDTFFTLSDCKKRILDRLKRHNCLQAISESLKRKGYSTTQVGIPDLRHFMYKSRSTAQFTSPDFEAPYISEDEQARLYALYRYLHHRIHSAARPLKILFHVGEYETLLGWVTSGFELYAIFGPLVTKPVAIASVNRLLKWIKKEEDRLFILNSPTF